MLGARFSITNGESDSDCRSKSLFEAFARFIDDEESMMAMVVGVAEFDRQFRSNVCRTGTSNQFLAVMSVETSKRSYPRAKIETTREWTLYSNCLRWKC